VAIGGWIPPQVSFLPGVALDTAPALGRTDWPDSGPRTGVAVVHGDGRGTTPGSVCSTPRPVDAAALNALGELLRADVR
jgi:hypothetical protein